MNELIQVLIATIDGEMQQAVSLRDLHTKMKVGRDFSSWVKDRLIGFVEGKDYVTSKFDSPNLGNQTSRGGDRRSIDYLATLDTGKHVAMLERNEFGFAIRQYLINIEKQLRNPDALLRQRRVEMRRSYTDALKLKGVHDYGYGLCTAAGYRGAFKMTVQQIRQVLRIKKGSPHDSMSPVEQNLVALYESMTATEIVDRDICGNSACASATEQNARRVGDVVRSAGQRLLSPGQI